MFRSFAAGVLPVFVFLGALPAALAQNQPPVAEPQVVFTRGVEPLEIVLRGSDPEQGDLTFRITEPPRYGELSEPVPIVPEPVVDPRTGDLTQPPITSASVVYRAFEAVPDGFTFVVADPKEATGTAAVTINPPQNEPPPPPVETVIAQKATDQVFRDTQKSLTMSGAAPEGVSLKFSLLTKPRSGTLGELMPGSEVPQRTASVSYTPERGFVGDDFFDFEVCGEIKQQLVCDAATFTINVIERPEEPLRLAADVQAKTTVARPVTFSLADDHRTLVPGDRIVLRGDPAGNVADKDDDGFGDNANNLPGDSPIFMRAGVKQDGEPGAVGTSRMHIEWDLSQLQKISGEIVRADVLLHTYRPREEGLTTFFYAAGRDADGALKESDFETDAERVRGAVMPMPSLREMPVGAEGTFSFDVVGSLKAALQQETRFFAVQGRVDETFRDPAAGLDVRTSAFENLDRQLEPELTVETAVPPPPLAYTVMTLPEVGTLADANRNVIRQVPYALPNSTVTYTPPAGYSGQTSFTFHVSDGVFFDSAIARIFVIFGNCWEDSRYCNNGR